MPKDFIWVNSYGLCSHCNSPKLPFLLLDLDTDMFSGFLKNIICRYYLASSSPIYHNFVAYCDNYILHQELRFPVFSLLLVSAVVFLKTIKLFVVTSIVPL